MKNIDDKEREKKCKKAFFSHRAEIGNFLASSSFLLYKQRAQKIFHYVNMLVYKCNISEHIPAYLFLSPPL